MTFAYLKSQNLIISKTKRAFEVKEKTFFLVSQLLSFRNIKQTSKNVADTTFKEFCDLCNLKTLIKEPTCFKKPENPTCIDPMLTNSHRSFHKSCAIETGLSDFHKMIVTVTKSYFQKKE